MQLEIQKCEIREAYNFLMEELCKANRITENESKTMMLLKLLDNKQHMNREYMSISLGITVNELDNIFNSLEEKSFIKIQGNTIQLKY